MFLPSKILEVQALKICTRLTAHQVAKFREVALSGPKVICAHTLDFKPIFECSLSNNCWGPSSPVRCVLASLGHSLAHVIISGGSNPKGRNMLFRKSWFWWVQTQSNFVLRGPKFTRLFFPNGGGIPVDHVFPILGISIHSRDICSRRSKVVRNHPKFCTFLAPKFFLGGGPPEFWDQDYKIKYSSDHVAEFHGYQPWTSEIVWQNKNRKERKKETSAAKHKTAGNYRTEQPNESLYMSKNISESNKKQQKWSKNKCIHLRKVSMLWTTKISITQKTFKLKF